MRKTFKIATAIFLIILFITLANRIFTDFNASEDLAAINGNMNLRTAKGLLLPTLASVSGYIKADSDLGFGGNGGCFNAYYSETLNIRGYCFEYYVPGLEIDRKEIKFIAVNSIKFENIDYDLASRIVNYNLMNFPHVSNKFKYNNSEGILLNYQINGETSKINVWEINWFESNNSYYIKFTESNELPSTPNQIINILTTLRRSEGKKFSNLEEGTNPPVLIESTPSAAGA